MGQTGKENTLFLGNGFSKSIFSDVPSWGSLYKEVKSTLNSNYTILYEKYFLEKKRKGYSEEAVKEELVETIRKGFSGNNIKEENNNLNKFGQYLNDYGINNIITTNYDYGIETILETWCGYERKEPKNLSKEDIYSIRTYKLFVHKETGHHVQLWKIHGDLDRIKSIMLGYDQYCGSLSKLDSYIKGCYRSSHNVNFKSIKKMDEKCVLQQFDEISWIELFFRTDVYIIGFGLDFSEIDIWWILNKRARLMIDISNIKNQITYLYNKNYETPLENEGDGETIVVKKALFEALDAFQVKYLPLNCNLSYVDSIFEPIKYPKKMC